MTARDDDQHRDLIIEGTATDALSAHKERNTCVDAHAT
jgi:hypothetical protein